MASESSVRRTISAPSEDGHTIFVLHKPRLRSHKKSRAGCVTCKKRRVKVRVQEEFLMNFNLTTGIVRRTTAQLRELLQDRNTVHLCPKQQRVLPSTSYRTELGRVSYECQGSKL